MIMTKSGTMCRQQIKTISTQRRESMGVIIVKIDPRDEVIGIEQVVKEDVIDSENHQTSPSNSQTPPLLS